MRFCLLLLCACILAVGCSSANKIEVPKSTIAALKPGDVQGMGAGSTPAKPPGK